MNLKKNLIKIDKLNFEKNSKFTLVKYFSKYIIWPTFQFQATEANIDIALIERDRLLLGFQLRCPAIQRIEGNADIIQPTLSSSLRRHIFVDSPECIYID